MADEEVVQQVEELVEPPAEEGVPQEGVDFEVVGDNRFKWKDTGLVTDADGNEAQDEPIETPEVTPEPEPRRVEPRAEVRPEPTRTVTPVQGERQIYRRDLAKQSIYTDEALAEIVSVSYDDPAKAERMRADMAERYQNAVQSIDRHSNQVFEQELDDIATHAPKAVTGLSRQIQRAKEQMTPEQRQMPGAARNAFAQAVAEAATKDLLTAEEIYVRSTTHESVPKVPTTATAPTVAPKRPIAVIPKEERTPGAGSARPVRAPRRPSFSEEEQSISGYAKFQKELHPDWTEEECMEVAKGALVAQHNARMARIGG